MMSALKATLSPKNLKILRPKVTKILRNCLKKFCESPPCFLLFGHKTSSLKNDKKCFHSSGRLKSQTKSIE